MDFFEHQEQARKRTTLLVCFFALAVIGILVAFNAAAGTYFYYDHARTVRRSLAYGEFVEPFSWADPTRVAIVSAITVGVILLGTLWRVLQLRAGGRAVAEMLGATPIADIASGPHKTRLQNVVEEMSIASGVPVPDIYVLVGENGINAFAAGWSTNSAVVAVTEGAMTDLTRDELQGVIGHEFSHILNSDMRLNLRLIGVLHGILLFGLTGKAVLRAIAYGGGGRKRGEAVAIAVAVGVVLLVVGYVGYFFGNLIKAAVSRQREFLADAASVQFTRNPKGIAGALARIGGFAGSSVSHPKAEGASHMFFGEIVSRLTSHSLFATHPPLADRVRRLDPNFSDDFEALSSTVRAEAAAGENEQVHGFAAAPAQRPSRARVSPTSASSTDLVASGGSVTSESLAVGRELIGQIPEPMLESARNPYAASSLVAGLLLSDEPGLLARQKQLVAGSLGQDAEKWAVWVQTEIARRGRHLRLPLLSLAAPALRHLADTDKTRLASTLDTLIRSDGSVDLFEFAVQRVALRMLYGDAIPTGQKRAANVGEALTTLVSVLAAIGANGDGAAAGRAFEVATNALGFSGAFRFVAYPTLPIDELHAGLNLLASAPPKLRRQVLQACSAAAAADGLVTLDEAELLRAVSDSLGCPIPPMAARPASG